jgi:hypothetical protein
MSSIEEESPEESRKFIKRLHEASKEDMMEAMYSSIVNGKMGALKHDGTIEEKIEGVQTVLNFFKDNEDYEKCKELKMIIGKLSSNII